LVEEEQTEAPEDSAKVAESAREKLARLMAEVRKP
jgi:hypothetical protein